MEIKTTETKQFFRSSCFVTYPLLRTIYQALWPCVCVCCFGLRFQLTSGPVICKSTLDNSWRSRQCCPGGLRFACRMAGREAQNGPNSIGKRSAGAMFNQQVGLQSLLKDGGKHFSGVDEALLKNIEACKRPGFKTGPVPLFVCLFVCLFAFFGVRLPTICDKVLESIRFPAGCLQMDTPKSSRGFHIEPQQVQAVVSSWFL